MFGVNIIYCVNIICGVVVGDVVNVVIVDDIADPINITVLNLLYVVVGVHVDSVDDGIDAEL